MTMKNLLLFLAMLFSAPAWAETIYVCDCGTGAHGSCSAGSNGNSGASAAAALQSTTAATIRGAASGDIYRFCEGGAWSASPFVSLYKRNDTGGNLNANIVVNSYAPPTGATGRPRFNVASGACVQFDGQFGDTDYDGPWTIDGIDCRGTGASAGPAFLISRYTRGVTIRNSYAENWERGVQTYENHYDVSLVNNTFQTIYADGFLSVSSLLGILVEYNTWIDVGINAPTAGPTEHGMYLGCTETPGCTNVVIRRNTWRNTGAQTGNANRCGGGTLTVHGAISGALIENNFIDNSQYGYQGGCLGISITAQYGFAEYMRNFEVRGNRVVNSGSCVTIKSAPGVIVENNVCTMSQSGFNGVAFGHFVASGEDDPDTASIWRNNLLYIASASGGGVGFDTSISGSANMVMSSNVVYFGASSGTNYCYEHNALGSYTSFDRNYCYSASGAVNFSPTYSNLGVAQAAGFDTNGGNTNPNFVALPGSGNSYAACDVNSGSPLINGGSATHSARLSVKGRLPSGTRDVGPCEFGVD